MPLSFVSYEGHGKATSDGGEQNGFLASIPALGRRLFLCRFTPIHLRFRHLLFVFQDSRARGGIRENRGKNLSRVGGRAIFVPEGETGPFLGP